MRLLPSLALTAATLLTTACADTHFYTLAHAQKQSFLGIPQKPLAEEDVEGIHYWETVPYLLVSKVSATTKPADPGTSSPHATASEADTYQLQIIYLPGRPMVAQSHNGWGTQKFSLTLTNGWQLTTLDKETDSKAPETLTALTGPLTALKGIIPLIGNQPSTLTPGLYAIQFNDHGIITGITHVLTSPE